MKKIIEFLEIKIDNLKVKIHDFESPIMQDMNRSSSHYQYEYIRHKAQLESYEDILLTIQGLTDELPKKAAPVNPEVAKQPDQPAETSAPAAPTKAKKKSPVKKNEKRQN